MIHTSSPQEERRLAGSNIIGSSDRIRYPALRKSPNGTHSKGPEELNIGLCLFRVSRLVSDGALELALLMSGCFPPRTGAHEEEPEETLRCKCHEQASISQRCRLQSGL